MDGNAANFYVAAKKLLGWFEASRTASVACSVSYFHFRVATSVSYIYSARVVSMHAAQPSIRSIVSNSAGFS
jgi:hypothetical protein